MITKQQHTSDSSDTMSHRVEGLKRILADRERELLEIKGPCSSRNCRLHYAHAGPCDCRSLT